MCDGATTHQKPSRLRGGGFILFGARAEGLSAVITVVSYDATRRAWERERERGYPIYLTTSAEPKPKRPRGLIANRRLLSSLLPCTYTMCPLCTGVICISLGARENLIASGGTRRAVVAASTSTRKPFARLLFYPSVEHLHTKYHFPTVTCRENIFLPVRAKRGSETPPPITLAKLRNHHDCPRSVNSFTFTWENFIGFLSARSVICRFRSRRE